jgi:hypothetical protein
VLAARAGMDLLLCAKQPMAQGDHALSALAGALGAHRLNSASFTASAQRVLELRTSLAK